MLSPLSPALSGSSVAGGNDAITLMSGSGSAPGITIRGSSPGRQRSMPSAEPPSDELPKNRLAVFTENASGEGAGSRPMAAAPRALFKASSGWASSDIDTSYWASGGALSASCSSGSSGARSGGAAASAVFAPATELLEVDGSSFEGAALVGAGGSGGTTTSRSPFRVRSTLGKSSG